ncbi:MAG: extracellular solute-binding protein [Sphaerochaetaceae bacterium]|nr:extracellular solute-binding protein [Sphaerochaetaceae bacterium]
MKKTIIVLLVALFAFSAFAQSAPEAKTTELMHITCLYPPTASEVGALPDDWAGYAVLRDELGIDAEFQMLPSSSSDQDILVRSMAAADQLPDFFATSRSVWADLVKNGQVLEVGQYYDDMPNRCSVMFGEAARNYVTVDGKIYGFACPSAYAGNEGLIIRKDWLDNLGLAAPTTLDELYDVLYAFTYNDPDGNGKNDTYGYGAFVEETVEYEIYPGRRFEPLMGAFGVEGTWDMTAANFGLQIHKPAYYDWMVFLKKVIDAGIIDPNWQSYKKDDFRAAWKQGKFGCFREQNSAYASENNYSPFDANFPDGGFIVIDAPIGPNGDQSVGPKCEGFRIYALSADCSPEKAAKIIEMFEWASYGEGYMLCGFGEEGKNYIYDADGLPQSDPSLGEYGYSQATGQRYIQLRCMAFNYNNAQETALRYPAYITKVSQKRMAPGEVLTEMQSKTWTNTPGQNSMPKPDSTDVTTFYQQSLAEFLNGTKALTPENWAAFIAKFDQIGGKAWEEKGYQFALDNGLLQ